MGDATDATDALACSSSAGSASVAHCKTEHECVICNAVFSDRQLLQDHFRQHATGSGPVVKRKLVKKCEIQCDICPAKFDTASKAVQHKFKMHRSHTEKYYCPWCGKQFTIKQMYEMHFNNDHVDKSKDQSEPVFKCEQCVAFFYVKSVYDNHISQYHHYSFQYFMNNTRVLPPSKKIIINCIGDVQSAYYCHLCGYEYVLKYNLQNHLAKYHKDYDPSQLPAEIIKCSTCEASFYNKKAYEVHNSFHQPGDMYVTSEEMRLNVVTRVDQDFDLRRVRYFGNAINKPKRNNYQTTKKTLVKEEDMSAFSPPPSDSSDSELEFSSSIKTYSKKKSVSINEFVDLLNNDAFEDKPKDSENVVSSESGNCKNVVEYACIKKEVEEPFYETPAVLIKNTPKINADTKIENKNTDLLNTELKEAVLEPQIKLIDTQKMNVDIDEKTGSSRVDLNKQLSKVHVKDSKIPVNKRSVKVVSKEELEKLKSKGLVRLVSKDQIINMKKGNMKLEEISNNETNSKMIKSSKDSKVCSVSVKESKKISLKNVVCKREPIIRLTRIDESILKNVRTSKSYSAKFISKRTLRVA